MDVGIKNFRAFVAVVEEGSFTRAADRLRLAQPSVTVAVKNLEKRLGVPLFDRTNRGLKLTADGVELLGHARRVVRDFSELVESFRRPHGERETRVSVALVPGVAALAGAAMLKFAAQFPLARVRLRDGNSAEVVRAILEGTADFGIASSVTSDPDLLIKVVVLDEYGVVCRSGSRLARRRSVRWSDLAEERFVAFAPGASPRSVLDRLAVAQELIAEARIEVANMAAAEALLEAGMGVIVMPQLGAPPGRRRRLVFRRLVEPRIQRELALVTRRDRPLGTAATALADILAVQTKKVVDSFDLDT